MEYVDILTASSMVLGHGLRRMDITLLRFNMAPSGRMMSSRMVILFSFSGCEEDGKFPMAVSFPLFSSRAIQSSS